MAEEETVLKRSEAQAGPIQVVAAPDIDVSTFSSLDSGDCHQRLTR